LPPFFCEQKKKKGSRVASARQGEKKGKKSLHHPAQRRGNNRFPKPFPSREERGRGVPLHRDGRPTHATGGKRNVVCLKGQKKAAEKKRWIPPTPTKRETTGSTWKRKKEGEGGLLCHTRGGIPTEATQSGEKRATLFHKRGRKKKRKPLPTALGKRSPPILRYREKMVAFLERGREGETTSPHIFTREGVGSGIVTKRFCRRRQEHFTLGKKKGKSVTPERREESRKRRGK